jgi:hypothetical protein
MGAVDEATRCYERAAGILRQLRNPSQADDAVAARQLKARAEVFTAPAM